MSLQDESFPDDEFFKESSFLNESGNRRSVFPRHNARRLQRKSKEDVATTNTSATSSNDQNVSSGSSSTGCPVSEGASSNEQNISGESSSGGPASEASVKTNASEPNRVAADNERKQTGYTDGRSNTKAISYHDIHSEYTKRRYRHIESKVGQYIANIKAEDQKRRNSSKASFQRHRSMPETLSGSAQNETPNKTKKCGIMCHSANDLDKVHESAEYTERGHFAKTISTTTPFTRELRHDAGIVLDRNTYEQLLSEKERCDYLQTKLEEKNAENWRLKQNVDFMRIELTECKDKLRQKQQNSYGLSGSFGSINAVGALGRHSLQTLIYCSQTKCTQATQTETVPMLPYGNETLEPTPSTPDTNNNTFEQAEALGVLAPIALRTSKTIATIQPISLNFSNVTEQDSRESTGNSMSGLLRRGLKKKAPLPTAVDSVANSSCRGGIPNSSDSAIESESTESPHRSDHLQTKRHSRHVGTHSGHYTALEARSVARVLNETDQVSADTVESSTQSNKKSSRKRRFIRWRVLRLFGSCARCEDHNQTLDPIVTPQQPSYTQIPLLEKSFENDLQDLH